MQTGLYFRAEENPERHEPRCGTAPEAYLHPQVQEMLDNVDLPVGGCSMQRGITLLILTGNFSAVVNKQGHNIQVTLTKQSSKNTINLK